MKLFAVFLIAATNLSHLKAQEPLSGYDLFEVVQNGSVSATPFKFESYLSGKLVRGVMAPTPVVTARDVGRLELRTEEVSAAPCTVVSALFRPSAKDKLLPILSRNKSAEVVIVIAGKPQSTFRVAELIQLVDNKAALFVMYPLETSEQFRKAEAMLKQVQSGQWSVKAKESNP